MIKAIIEGAENSSVIVGLSAANMLRLVNGEPIWVDLDELAQAANTTGKKLSSLLILGGRSEEEILTTMRRELGGSINGLDEALETGKEFIARKRAGAPEAEVEIIPT